MTKDENKIDDSTMELLIKSRERREEEVPHLTHLVTICREEHYSYVAPLVGVMRSFARFTETEDNIAFLNDTIELFSSYAYSKQNKDSKERRTSKTIIQTLKDRKNDIETHIRKGFGVDFQFDFYPLLMQYQFLCIYGHRPTNEEEDICKTMLLRVADIAERELQKNHTALSNIQKALS